MTSAHIPVLLGSVIEKLAPTGGGVYLDGTFGAGGYSAAILESCDCRLIAFDRDVSVSCFVEKLSQKYGERFKFFNQRFSAIAVVLRSSNIKLDGAVFDLGLSSMQIDNAERGFSFQKEAKLDMRMGLNEYSAYDVVNNFPRQELEAILLKYGDEYRFKGIVEKIIKYRTNKPIETTLQLADIVFSVYGRRGRIHPATKTFQAIRAFVNNEVVELETMLQEITNFLNVGAKVAIVSFNSLEDRIVKNYFRKIAKNGFSILTKKPIIATRDEILVNPRSRSAKLRVVEVVSGSFV